jgi:putative FmdB family regulatory protein
MPIYDYKCQHCGQVSEVFLRGVDNVKPMICPICGSERMEKLFSGSYLLQTETTAPGRTCCGREERCEAPACSTGDTCARR